MDEFDISVIVTAHTETVLAGPTIHSAENAINQVESAGYKVERLIGLDAPSSDCRTYFSQPKFEYWNRIEMAFMDQGKIRNHMSYIAKGKWVAFLDADDLYSENWLLYAALCLKNAENKNDKIIVHPELNWIFDQSAGIVIKMDQKDELFDPYLFYFANYYDALCMAPKSAYVAIPYVERDIENGFALEDWQWNIETIEAGWKHVIAKDTIIFKRRRELSQNINASKRSAVIRNIEPMAIDNINNLGR